MKIAILVHTNLNNYLMTHLGQLWAGQGHSVTLVTGLDQKLPPADILVMHIDMTVVPPDYAEAVKSHPLVINRNIPDISKHLFSQILLNPADAYSGPVIVKTKNNCGGLPEMRLRIDPAKLQEVLNAQTTWDKVEGMVHYPIFDSLQQVPPSIWKNKHLIVEKFLPERSDDGHFFVREWIFLGTREIHFMNISPAPIVKGKNVIRREYLPPDSVPAELEALRKKMGFDYGKFDYVMYNGKPVLLDVNRTPGAPPDLSDRSGAVDRVAQLSVGLEYYLPKMAR